jgi:ATP-dependent DNA helicase DinG
MVAEHARIARQPLRIYHLSEKKSTVVKQNDFEARIDEFFGENGRLSAALSGFEYREGQLIMARAVGRAFAQRRSLMVEAGTGTGKTLAYLVPALFSGKKVVVSTGTINLQEQIVEKDVPIIERAMGKSVRAVVLKGRSNYLCLRRYDRFSRQRGLAFGEGAAVAAQIERWAKRTRTGDRAELTDLPEEFALWGEVSSSPETCIGAKCPRFEDCFVSRARRRAQAADIVVVNHHLFFVDLMMREMGAAGVIPGWEAVVLDEAHNIERIAAEYFSLSISPFRIDVLTRDVLSEMALERITERSIERAVLAVTAGSLGFFNAVGGRVAEGKARISTDFFNRDDRELALGLASRLSLLADAIRVSSVDHEPILAAARRAQEIADNLRFIVTMPDRQYVYWSQTRGGDVAFYAAPIDIAKELQQKLHKKVETIIFTSATLSVMGTFDFFTESVGVGPDVEGMIAPGGFDTKKNALLFIPPDLPEPDRATPSGAVMDMIGRLLAISRGRALVLFTSVRNMEAAYAGLRDTIPMKVMIQGGAPKRALLAEFRDDISSVLFATASFWEGVDVPGEALSLVIIDKLPFDRPTDPIIEAKLEYMRDRDQNPFYRYQLPRAVITLRQGLGRLIRSQSDRGVLAVLDSRIRQKQYGRVFLRSLSHFAFTDNLQDVADFFREQDS